MPEPCLDDYFEKLSPLLSGGNATLFATADLACGGDAFAVVTQTVLLRPDCLSECE